MSYLPPRYMTVSDGQRGRCCNLTVVAYYRRGSTLSPNDDDGQDIVVDDCGADFGHDDVSDGDDDVHDDYDDYGDGDDEDDDDDDNKNDDT